MNILYFSPILWDSLKQRPQHIAEGLSKKHKVVFYEPVISFLNSLKSKNHLYKGYEKELSSSLKVKRLSGLLRLPRSLDIYDPLGINNISERLQLMSAYKECDAVWLGSPLYYSCFKGLKDKLLIYDKMDDYSFITPDRRIRKLIQRNEIELIKSADIIFTSYSSFKRDVSGKSNAVLVKNGADEINKDSLIQSSEAEMIRRLRNSGRCIFGYVGTIDYWFDFEAVKRILKSDSRNAVVIVGNRRISCVEDPDIIYIDAVDKRKLPGIIDEFDFCLYNFKFGEYLDTINPVKIYEYLGLNKPVISVRSSETEVFGNLLNRYSSYEGLESILKGIQQIGCPFLSEEERMIFINDNTWHRRIELIEETLNNFTRGEKHGR